MQKTAPADVWVARLTKAGVPAGPVLSIPDALALAQAQTGDLLNEFPTLPDRTGNAGAPAGSDGKGGEARLRVLRSGFRYSGTRPEIDRPLLLLGQHTDYGIWAS